MDASGRAFVTGNTSSTESTFPVAGGPDLSYNGGTKDAFVANVNVSGTALSYAGYIGGSSVDLGDAVAVDCPGNAYVSGGANSDESTFPVKGGPDLTHNGSGPDAFLAKVRSTGYCPDGKIKRSSSASFVGNDVYNLTAARQTVTATGRRGSSKTFVIREQNDGTVADTIRVKGQGPKPGFSVHYLAGITGTTDITAAVEGGTYALRGIGPGGAKALRLVVGVKPGASIGTIRGWLVTGTSNHDPGKKDTVQGKLKVLSG